MASRMNSGGSNDLNCIEIDPLQCVSVFLVRSKLCVEYFFLSTEIFRSVSAV